MDTLDKIKADRRFVEVLVQENILNDEGRSAALDILYPADKWGIWVSRVLLMLGTVLILSGVVYFFAFNWAKLTTTIKFGLIEGAFVLSLAIAYWQSLERVYGQIAVLSAAVLVGVFMAVFGQIYQTGADAYELFVNWSVMIFLWAVLARFLGLWVLWWLVTNTAIWFWWTQDMSWTWDVRIYRDTLLALFNGGCLFAIDYFNRRGHHWLHEKWSSLIVGVLLLYCLNVPALFLILDRISAAHEIYAGICGIIGHGVYFYNYRYRTQNIWHMALWCVSILVLAVAFGGQLFLDWIGDESNSINILLTGLYTIAVFALAGNYLRKLTLKFKQSDEQHE